MIGKKTETIEELIGLLQKFIKDFEYLKEPNYNEMKKRFGILQPNIQRFGKK